MPRRSLLALAVAMLVSACAASDAADDDASTPSSDPNLPALSVWCDPAIAGAVEEVATTFQAREGVQVVVTALQPDVIEEDLVAQGPFGKGPDVVVAFHQSLGLLLKNGAVAPVDVGDAVDAFPAVAVEAVTAGDQTFGIPLTLESLGLVRNTRLVPSAPSTWDELIGSTPGSASGGDQASVAIPIDPDGHPAYDLYPLQASFGVEVFGTDEAGGIDTRQLLLGGETGDRFAASLGQWAAEGLVSTDVTPDVAQQLFVSGRVPYWITDSPRARDAQAAGVSVAVSEIPPPADEPATPLVLVRAAMVSNYSDDKELARTFVVDSMATPPAATAIAGRGIVPALDVPLSPGSDGRALKAWRDIAVGGDALPGLSEMAQVWPPWDAAVLDIVDGAEDPIQVWDQMAHDVARELDVS